MSDTETTTDRRLGIAKVTPRRAHTITTYFHPARRRIAKLHKKTGKPKSELSVKGLQVDERVVTLVWQAGWIGGEPVVAYGASVYHKESHREEWQRKQHRATAIGRLTTIPNILTLEALAQEALDSSNLDWATRIRNCRFDRETNTFSATDERTLSHALRNFALPKYGVDSTK